MGQSLLTRAAQGEQEAFRELTDPYRRELQFHCYRILGSMQSAEDALQETLLSAWRGLSGYEGTASLRGGSTGSPPIDVSMPCARSAAGRRRHPSRHSPRRSRRGSAR